MPTDAADRCDCGAVRDRSITWCSQCHAPHPPLPEPPDPRFAAFGEPVPDRPPAPYRAPRLERGSRWRGTEITFGPAGRIVMSVLVTLPLLWFLSRGIPFGIVGVVVYGGVLYPWALRDIWRRARGPRRDRPPADPAPPDHG